MPHHALGVAEGNRERGLRRRIERGGGLCQTAERTRSTMGGRRVRLVVRTALLGRAMADDGGGQRIGHGRTCRQTGGDRRQHLHRQSEQDQG